MMRRMRIRMRMRMRMRMIWILMEYPTEWWKIVTASVPESSTSRSACGLWNPVKPLRKVKPLHPGATHKKLGWLTYLTHDSRMCNACNTSWSSMNYRPHSPPLGLQTVEPCQPRQDSVLSQLIGLYLAFNAKIHIQCQGISRVVTTLWHHMDRQ